jgi:hypothetical protein
MTGIRSIAARRREARSMPASRGIPGGIKIQTSPFPEVQAPFFDVFSTVARDFLDFAAGMGT